MIVEVVGAVIRNAAGGLLTEVEDDSVCCYARQDKVWVHDPAGAPWEVYTVKDEDPAGARPATATLEILGDSACCTSTASGATASGATASDAGAEPKAQACCS